MAKLENSPMKNRQNLAKFPIIAVEDSSHDIGFLIYNSIQSMVSENYKISFSKQIIQTSSSRSIRNVTYILYLSSSPVTVGKFFWCFRT